jgi:hypothetical protein
MKLTILGVAGLGALIALGWHLNSLKHRPVAQAEPVVEAVAEPIRTQQGLQPAKTALAETPRVRPLPWDRAGSNLVVPASSAVQDIRLAFNRAIETLVSPQASYPQKQAAWKELNETGKLDLAISELEQRAATEPGTAETSAALGQAYLKKCALIQDVREQGILAMKADQVFDAALTVDPANWEARYTKAVAMSYWPAQMNKGPEVIENFRTLIEQQETQAPQPQFAQSYAWLGDQYQKSGYPDYATQVWQRGAALFPGDDGLKRKLTPTP